jgi:hypothetical protein
MATQNAQTDVDNVFKKKRVMRLQFESRIESAGGRHS